MTQHQDIAGAIVALPILVCLILRSRCIDAWLLWAKALMHPPQCRCSRMSDGALMLRLSGPTIEALSRRRRVTIQFVLIDTLVACQCVTAINLGGNAVLIPQSTENNGVVAYFEPQGSGDQHLTISAAGLEQLVMAGILFAEVNGQQHIPIMMKPPCVAFHGCRA